MTFDETPRHGEKMMPLIKRAAEHGSEFLRSARNLPAHAAVDMAAARERLVKDLPEEPTPGDQVFEDFIAAAKGGIVPTMGGRFFSFVIGGIHEIGTATDMLAAAWDDNQGTPLAAPFGCAVDELVGEWVLDLLDLPREASVGLVTGATIGNFVGICAARNALLARQGWDVEADGLYGAPKITVLISANAHPALRQGLRLAGFGERRVIQVPCDNQGRMLSDVFAHELAATKGPVLVCAQIGQINTGAADPLLEIGARCREHGAWLHIDGAFGLWARTGETTKDMAVGAELGDSWSVDAHKWLNTPYDGAFAIVRDREAHAKSMAVTASYLPQPPGARDPSHFVPELSRRARGYAIYNTIRLLGRKGIAEAIDRCCAHARLMRDLLSKDDFIASRNDVVLNQAVFRCMTGSADPREDDKLTADVALAVRKSGDAFIQSAFWQGETVLRFSVTDHNTTENDIRRAAAAVLRESKALRG